MYFFIQLLGFPLLSVCIFVISLSVFKYTIKHFYFKFLFWECTYKYLPADFITNWFILLIYCILIDIFVLFFFIKLYSYHTCMHACIYQYWASILLCWHSSSDPQITISINTINYKLSYLHVKMIPTDYEYTKVINRSSGLACYNTDS